MLRISMKFHIQCQFPIFLVMIPSIAGKHQSWKHRRYTFSSIIKPQHFRSFSNSEQDETVPFSGHVEDTSEYSLLEFPISFSNTAPAWLPHRCPSPPVLASQNVCPFVSPPKEDILRSDPELLRVYSKHFDASLVEFSSLSLKHSPRNDTAKGWPSGVCRPCMSCKVETVVSNARSILSKSYARLKWRMWLTRLRQDWKVRISPSVLCRRCKSSEKQQNSEKEFLRNRSSFEIAFNISGSLVLTSFKDQGWKRKWWIRVHLDWCNWISFFCLLILMYW